MKKVFQTQLAGRTITAEIGALAGQAGGSVLIRCGDTVLLVCATMSAKPRDNIDFFPLSVDFEEKLYAVGKIPGGFIKREGRPSERAVLTSRLIDRPIRPLFPKGVFNDVSVVATALSVDTNIPPEVYAMIGSSIALSISDIPFAGPTGSVVVGRVDGEYILNPDLAQKEKSDMYVTVSGTKEAILMVEASAHEVSEDAMLGAILFAHDAIKELVAWQEGIAAEVGKPKRVIEVEKPDEGFVAEVEAFAGEKLDWALDTFDREERQNRSAEVEAEAIQHFEESRPGSAKEVSGIIYDMTKKRVRRRILEDGVRPDGRSLTEIRPIWCDVGFLPRTHGSGIFTRGQTQVMTMATLGALTEVQRIDGLTEEDCKRYMHHYNMPSYSVGETRPARSPGRREIGHGALAERALEPVLPSEEEFPYAIRLVSEVVSSNGSTSQASVCGSTLALMDAGVPIKRPVAGVAMGLMQDAATGKIAVLTDIQGLEDFLGDMDFKVAGTAQGITAIQMDIKIKGINREILERALAQAHDGRQFILGKMLETLPAPRAKLSPYAPKITSFAIHPDKIREVIGPGGKMINKIIAETGVKIDIEDDGMVYITTPDEAAAAKAKAIIISIVREIQAGDVYRGKVVRIIPIGAFVELAPGKDGMIHISKLANRRVEKVEDEVNVGDEVIVKVTEIDKQGRINLIRRGITEADLEAFQASQQ
nr:polyribonucleotide nucleotidyltransferase [bacterium]